MVALNQGYVLEALRAEGVSPWFAASHDEFVIVMDGVVEVDLVKLEDADAVVAPDRQGSVLVGGEPKGPAKWYVKRRAVGTRCCYRRVRRTAFALRGPE